MDLANQIGSSSVVLSIELKKLMTTGMLFIIQEENSKIKVIDWIQEGINKGAGEIFLTSVDKEGTENGFDLDLLHRIKKLLNIKKPLIISGGIRDREDIIDANNIINISAVGVAFYIIKKNK